MLELEGKEEPAISCNLVFASLPGMSSNSNALQGGGDAAGSSTELHSAILNDIGPPTVTPPPPSAEPETTSRKKMSFRRLSHELLIIQGKKNGPSSFKATDREGWSVWPTVGKAGEPVWIAEIDGLAASPYEGGKFYVRFEFDEEYPFKPPRIFFVTQMFHPNFYPGVGFDPVCVLPPSSRVPVHL
jgi:hypothetical protein